MGHGTMIQRRAFWPRFYWLMRPMTAATTEKREMAAVEEALELPMAGHDEYGFFLV